MNKKRNISVFVSLIVIMSLFVAVGWTLLTPPPTYVQGEVEATQIRVASKVPGRIETLLIKEGQTVQKGQQLIQLESPEIQAKMRQAEAARKAAKAQDKKAVNGARKEQITAAYNMWQKAKAGAEFAKKTFQRIEKLHNEGVIPAQKRDEAEAKFKAAVVTEQAAKAQYELAESGARYEDKQAAAALVQQADGAIAEVEAYMNETRLAAPISGEIAEIIAQTGELVSTGFPIVTIVDLEDIWVTFNLKEEMLSKMRKGDVFEAKFPALEQQSIKLEVTYLKALGDYATWRATSALGGFDQKTFEVRARPLEKVEGLRPGMTALIDWDNYKKLNK